MPIERRETNVAALPARTHKDAEDAPEISAGGDAETPGTRRPAGAMRVLRWLSSGNGSAWTLGLLGILVAFAVWQLITSLGLVAPLFLSSPEATWHALVDYVSSGAIWPDLSTSGLEFILGLGISVIAGVAIGVVYGLNKPTREFLSPLVIALNAMPQIAVIPLLILRFGVGIDSKIVMIVMMCIATILLNTATGMEVIDERFVRLSRSMAASRLQFLWTVALPSALPYIMTGIRICVGRALIGVVVGELFASRNGIGHLLVNSAANFNMPLLYAGLIVVTFFGIVLTQLIGVVERRVQAWRE
jgi:ABC-type nitrate/sulfonate/bicarbonate transport system permease component